jgi:hypothetical protein
MGWRRARSWSTAALGVSLSLSALGRAAEPSTAERVEKLRDQGFAALSARRFAEAADRFREAWELGKEFWDICNVGRAEMDLARWREAAEHLAICVKVMPEDQRPEFGERFERFRKEALAEVGALSLTANGPSADVRPSETKSEETKSEVVPASTPEAVPAPKRDAGPSLPEPPALAPKASVQEPDGLSGAAAQGKAQPRTALLLTGGALGVVGTAVGIGGFMAADRAYDDAEAMDQALKKTGFDLPCHAQGNVKACSELAHTSGQIVPFKVLGVGGIALAATGVAVIIYELVWAPSDNAKRGPNAAIIVTPEGGALGLTGSF